MYFLDKSSPSNFNFLDFPLLVPEVVQILHAIFETRRQFLYKLCTIFNILAKNISVKCKWIFLKLQYKVYREVSIFYFSAPCFLMFPHAQKYLNSQVRTNKLTNCSLPPWSKIRLNGTSFHVFLNSLGFYLSTDCLLNFL